MKKRLMLLCTLAFVVACAFPTAAMAKTGTKLSASITSGYEHYDKAPYLSGTLKTSSGKVLKDKTVKLYYRPAGGDYRYMSSKHTSSKGGVKFHVVLPGADMSGTWKMKYAGSSKYRAVTSSSKSTQVHVHFDGYAPAVQIGTDGGGDPIYRYAVTESLTAGRRYGIEAEQEVALRVDTSAGTTEWEDTSFYDSWWYEPGTTDNYTIYFNTSAAIGASDQLAVFIW
jgi:hypothetical protein